jgi:hypothetical protein
MAHGHLAIHTSALAGRASRVPVPNLAGFPRAPRDADATLYAQEGPANRRNTGLRSRDPNA